MIGRKRALRSKKMMGRQRAFKKRVGRQRALRSKKRMGSQRIRIKITLGSLLIRKNENKAIPRIILSRLVHSIILSTVPRAPATLQDLVTILLNVKVLPSARWK